MIDVCKIVLPRKICEDTANMAEVSRKLHTQKIHIEFCLTSALSESDRQLSDTHTSHKERCAKFLEEQGGFIVFKRLIE